MDDITPRLVTGLKARAHDARSDLYRYLRRRYRVLSATIARHEPSWAGIAAEVAAAGVMGAHGKPASPDALRRMWKRVCRDVDAEKAAEAGRRTTKGTRGVPPSRLPETARPPVEPPRAPVAPRTAPPMTTVSVPAAPREPSEAAKAKLAALDAQLAYRDRFVNPPKRKE